MLTTSIDLLGGYRRSCAILEVFEYCSWWKKKLYYYIFWGDLRWNSQKDYQSPIEWAYWFLGWTGVDRLDGMLFEKVINDGNFASIRYTDVSNNLNFPFSTFFAYQRTRNRSVNQAMLYELILAATMVWTVVNSRPNTNKDCITICHCKTHNNFMYYMFIT